MKLTDARVTLFPISTSRIGSVGQIAISEVDQQTTRRACGAQWRAYTAFEMPSTEGYLGTSFGYLLNKESASLSVVKSLLPVVFAANAHVPVEVREALNLPYIRTTNFIKSKLYGVIPYSPSQRVERIVLLDNAA